MKPVLTFLFFCCFILARSQSFDIQSIGLTKDKAALANAVMFKDHIYAVETEAKSKLGWTLNVDKVRMGCRLIQYGSSMEFINENVLANGDNVFGPFQPFFKVINEKLYLLSFDYNTTDGIIMNIAEADPATLVLSAPKKLFTAAQKNVGLFKLSNLYATYNFFIESSADKSKILFLWNPGVNNSFSYAVTDASLNSIGSGALLAENAEDLIIHSLYFDNAGNFYAAYNSNNKFKNVAGIMAVSAGGAIRTTQVDLGASEAATASIQAGPIEGQLRIAGAARANSDYIAGGYSMLMDKKSLAFSKSITKEIPQEMLEKFDKDAFAMTKKNKKGLYPEFEFADFQLPDGSVILAADLTRYQNMSANAPLQPVKGSTFVMTVAPGGNISFGRLAKREVFGARRENAFFAHAKDDKVYLFYLDTRDNALASADEAKCESFTSRKDNALVVAIIDKTGAITKRTINPPGSGSFYFSPAATSTTNDSTLLLGLGKDKVTLTRVKTMHAFYRMNISGE